MIDHLQTMVTCRWAAQRLGQYLDAERAVPLHPAERRRLEEHLATCRRCSAALAELAGIGRALARWGEQRRPDLDTVARMRALVADLSSDDR